MKSSTRFRAWIVGPLVGVLAIAGHLPNAGADSTGFVSDDFHAPALDAGRWTIVDPRGDTGVTSTGTNLLIDVAGGVAHRFTSSERTAPRVLQTVPNSDVEVEAKFESAPTAGAQTQGIVFQQDDTNLLAFGFEHDGAGTFVQVTSITGGKSKSLLRTATTSSPTMFLRVSRSGGAWTVRTSSDGATWATAGVVSRSLVLTSAGPFAGNAGTGAAPPPFTASVDYVFNTASPIDPEDGPVTPDTTPPVISNVTVTPTRNAALITWSTNEPSDSRVDLGTTAAYELGSTVDPADVTSHSVPIADLACESTYHVRVASSDPSGNEVTSGDIEFQTTLCTPPPPAGVISDDLSGPTLDLGRWTRVDPNGQSTLTMTGTGARVSLPAGLAHGFAGGVNRTVGIRQAVSDEDLEVDVAFEPTSFGAGAIRGLLIEEDADDYLRFEVSTNNCQFKILAAVQSGTTLTTRLNRTVPTPPTHLRARRIGNTWALSVSFDGLAWTQMASFSQSLSPTEVGPYVGSEGSAPPAVTATIDYVVNRAAPLAAEDGTPFEAVPDAPVIDVWNGPTLSVGSLGRPQSWVNLLGSVSDPDGLSSLRYSLNGSPPTTVPTGLDPGRLAAPGDFNVEIPWAALTPGPNTVSLAAVDRLGNSTSSDVTVDLGPGAAWPVPYSIDWSSAGSIDSVAQIVDGRWSIQGDEVRTSTPGYDRLIAIGDTTWTSYEISAPVTIHGYSAGPCVGPGVGFVVGWNGHTDPGQPRVGHPYGGLGWYRGKLEILRNGDAVLARNKTGPTLSLGTRYIFKMQMERTSVAPVAYTYRFKVWPASGQEPATWNLTGTYDFGGGSAMLLAHHADVSFGDVTIQSLG